MGVAGGCDTTCKSSRAGCRTSLVLEGGRTTCFSVGFGSLGFSTFIDDVSHTNRVQINFYKPFPLQNAAR